jgi:hypothetical protein
MALSHISLATLTEAHLSNLISGAAAESLVVEYKRETYGGSDDQRKEFLADISSFANASGGDLIIGMAAAKGVPTAFHPFVGDDDAERLRLEQIARDGLSPRIANLQTRAIPLTAGGHVIIVRVPKSYNPPHQIIFKGVGRFWARSSAGKYMPNVEELRRIFIEGPQLTERIRAFRAERITTIHERDALPVQIDGYAMMVLHVVPFSAFGVAEGPSIAELESDWQKFPPPGRANATHRYVNFDGFVVLSNGNPNAAQHHSYAQVFRNGAIEAVTVIERSDGVILASNIDKYTVASAKRYIAALSQFDIGFPMAVLVSLIGVADAEIESGIDGLLPPYGLQKNRQNILHFAEGIVESLPIGHAALALKLEGVLEQIWNMAGFASQQTVNSNGKWLFAGD